MFDICNNNDFKKSFVVDKDFDYRLLIKKKANFDISFYIISKSNVNINVFAISKNDMAVTGNININIRSPKVYVDTTITTMIGNSGFININGNIFVDKIAKGSVGNLLQRSIYVNGNGIARFAPSLFINCNDVKVSHGGKIEKLDDERLFYMLSRGIDKDATKKLLIASYIKEFLKDTQKKHFEKKLLDFIIS